MFSYVSWQSRSFNCSGRLSIGSTGHRDMLLGVALAGSSLDARGGIVGGAICLADITTYGTAPPLSLHPPYRTAHRTQYSPPSPRSAPVRGARLQPGARLRRAPRRPRAAPRVHGHPRVARARVPPASRRARPVAPPAAARQVQYSTVQYSTVHGHPRADLTT